MFTRVCLSIFREVTYVDSEGIGWSINFSDTGGGGYGCINGCVISSPSKTKVHWSQNIFRRTHWMVIGQVDRVRVINRKKVFTDETVLYDARNDDVLVHRNVTYKTYISDRGYLFYTPARCAVVRRDRSLLKSTQ